MKIAKKELQKLAAEWRSARRVYPLYSVIEKTFELGLGPCRPLESPIDRDDEAVLSEVREWLQKMDGRCTAAQIRQIVQHSEIGTEPCLRALIDRYLQKSERTAEDRFKLDFLLVQYFASSASRSVSLGKVELQDVARVLEPVIGECPLATPRFLEPLIALNDRIAHCKSLRDLIQHGVMDAGRKLKDEAGEMYFGSSVLVAFVRYNFLLRRAFVRLLHDDVEVIRGGLRELERAGAAYVDCSAAGFSGKEPLADLWQYCQSWRKVFVADYASGPSFESIAAIRQAVEAAVAAHRSEKEQKRAQAAAAAASPVAKPVVASAAHQPAEAKTISAEVSKIETARARVEALASSAPVVQPAKKPLGEQLQGAIADIAKLVAVASQKNGAAAVTLELAGSPVVLSSWEVLAFGKNDPVSLSLQKAVVARTLLMQAFKAPADSSFRKDLPDSLELGHLVAAELQEQIAQARDARKLDAAVSMAASAKRLINVMEEAERCLTASK